jgi:hypothetical protein
VSYIKELQDVIWKEHGVASRHIESVPVKKTFGGETIWDGIVEMFYLFNHPKATRAYAWVHTTNDPTRPKQHITVLHIPPVTSAAIAVEAAIIRGLTSREPPAQPSKSRHR